MFQATVTSRTLEHLPHVLLVVCEGQLDESTLGKLRIEVDKAMKQAKVSHVLLDFQEVEFLNSKVIGYLASQYSTSKEEDKQLMIVNPKPQIHDLLTLVGLTTLMSHFTSLEEALESIHASRQ